MSEDSNEVHSQPNRNYVDLKNQLFLLIIIPAFITALLIGASALYLQQKDLHQLNEEQGKLLVFQYKEQFEDLMADLNTETASSLSNQLINEKDVRAFSIYSLNSQNEVESLLHEGPRMLPEDKSRGLLPWLGNTQRFKANLDSSSGNADKKYFIEVELDRNVLLIHQYQSFFVVFGVSLVCFLITLIFAQLASSRFSEPIRGISYAISRIREGHLSTRVKSRFLRGELNELTSGVNAMAASLQEAHEDMQHSVDQATEDLRATLETIEIQNIELDFARKDAEQASRVKSQFLANISHEIRTPLNSIVGFTHLLLKSNLDDKQKDQLLTIQKSSENLLSIINDILDFSKIEAGKLNLEIEEVNIRETLNSVIELLQPLAREKKLKQILRVDEDVPDIMLSDSLRIQQVLTNLINNAIKFSDHGSLIIRVSIAGSKSTNSSIRFSVSDQGIGLSEKAKEKLFDPFHQSDTSNIRRFQGTGLGLTISRHLVEMLGGDIGVESTLGEGSTFWFTLPLSKPLTKPIFHSNKLQADTETLNPQVNDSPVVYNNSIPRILAVDDNPANLKLLCALLEDMGINYDACQSGQEAIELNQNHEYDLIFMDIQMPDLDGIETTRQIRQFDKRFSRHHAIVALTAHALDEEKQRFLELGFNHCLTKPIDNKLLMETIEHWTGYKPNQKQTEIEEALLSSGSQVDGNQVIDIEEGIRLAGKKPELANEMLAMLIENLPKDLSELSHLFEQKDFEALLEKVHYIHGACRYCGVPALRQATMEFEILLKNGKLENLDVEFRKMSSEIESLLDNYSRLSQPIHKLA